MDRLSKERRSQVMAKIRSKNTTPELRVRSLMHKMGYRFRLHDKKLPGSPDIVLKKYKTVFFVHGCFWHMHEGCKRSFMPKSRKDFWNNKLRANVERDKNNFKHLEVLGWNVVVIWECETKDQELLSKIIQEKIGTFA